LAARFEDLAILKQVSAQELQPRVRIFLAGPKKLLHFLGSSPASEKTSFSKDYLKAV
jgi:hypothetical protein